MKKIVIILIAAICLFLASCGTVPDGADNSGEIYRIEFVTNGGTELSALEVSELTEAPVSEREGYIFCGWYLDSALEQAVSYPLKVNTNMTLYARWIKSSYSLALEDASVQFSPSNEYSYKAEYAIDPKELDLQALSELGYYVKIDVSYDVYYEKDYDVAFDIGYMGAPDHDVSIVDIYDKGEKWCDLKTELEPKTNSVSLVMSASKLNVSDMILKLMTYNVQNVVYFKNIKVVYTCQPTA